MILMKMFSRVNIIAFTFLLLIGCSDNAGSDFAENSGNNEAVKAQERLEQISSNTEKTKTDLQAETKMDELQQKKEDLLKKRAELIKKGHWVEPKLSVLPEQTEFQAVDVKKVLDEVLLIQLPIPKGSVDVMPVIASYEGEKLSLLAMIRNGTDKDVTSKDLEKKNLIIQNADELKISAKVLSSENMKIGTLKPGEARPFQIEFEESEVLINNYPIDKGFNTVLK
jgi:SLAP domain-containing protein